MDFYSIECTIVSRLFYSISKPKSSVHDVPTHLYGKNGYTNFPKLQTPPQNTRQQGRDMTASSILKAPKDITHQGSVHPRQTLLTERQIYQTLFCTMTNICTIISQIITLLHVSTLPCHPQRACNLYLAKIHKYFKCGCW